MPNFSVNASASSADSGAVPEVTARTLARSSRVRSECSTIRSAAGTSDTARGWCSRTALAHFSRSNFGSNTNGRASVMHSNTRNTPPTCTSGEFTIATPRRSLGRGAGPFGVSANNAARQHVVGEVHAFGRAGGTAGQHPHRDTGPARVGCRRCGRRDLRGVGEVGDGQHRGLRGLAMTRLAISSARADDQRESQRSDIGSGPVVTAGRVDDHHGAAGGQHAEQRRDVRGLLRSRMPTRGWSPLPYWLINAPIWRAASSS